MLDPQIFPSGSTHSLAVWRIRLGIQKEQIRQADQEFIRGPGWSPPPMGFYIGILIKSSPPKGGVHKLMILLRDLPKEFLRKFFGEEKGGSGGPRPPSNNLQSRLNPNKSL